MDLTIQSSIQLTNLSIIICETTVEYIKRQDVFLDSIDLQEVVEKAQRLLTQCKELVPDNDVRINEDDHETLSTCFIAIDKLSEVKSLLIDAMTKHGIMNKE